MSDYFSGLGWLINFPRFLSERIQMRWIFTLVLLFAVPTTGVDISASSLDLGGNTNNAATDNSYGSSFFG